MNRFRDCVGALVVAGSLAGAVHQASAQPAPQEQETDAQRVAKQQRFIDRFRADLRKREATARAALARGDCEAFWNETDSLRNEWYKFRAGHSSRVLPDVTRFELAEESLKLSYSLERERCPPQTAQQNLQSLQTAVASGVQVQIGGGASSTQGIQVGNGSFNTDLNATGPKFDATLSVPVPGGLVPNSAFQARFYGFKGNGSSDLSGNAGTFLQANGGNQPINLNISSGETRAEITQIGGEVRFKLAENAPPVPTDRLFFNYTYSPFVGVGFERVTLDTETTVRISGLGFHASDFRTTETDRLFFTAGLETEIPIAPGGFVLRVFGQGQVNFDWVSATAVYDTAQVGVFAETLNNQFSRNAVTFGGKGGIGVAKKFASGARLEVVATITSLALYELNFHPGQPATVDDRYITREELAVYLIKQFFP